MVPGYTLSTDPRHMDVDAIHRWLSTETTWAAGRPRQVVVQSIAASLNFGLFHNQAGHPGQTGQAGYARVVTDLATFAWVCDVYVDRPHRGRGLGTWLAAEVCDHLAPLRLKRIMLSTIDAHGVYAKVGFVPFDQPERLMILAGAQWPARIPETARRPVDQAIR